MIFKAIRKCENSRAVKIRELVVARSKPQRFADNRTAGITEGCPDKRKSVKICMAAATQGEYGFSPNSKKTLRLLNKITAMLLSVLLLAGCAGIAASPAGYVYAENSSAVSVSTFTDVGGHWAYDYISECLSRGLFQGTSDTEFSPDGSVTRGMFVTVLGRLAAQAAEGGSAQSSDATNPFTDVKADKYYADYVTWAYNNNIASGTSETEFSPDTYISREQMAVFINNYLESIDKASAGSQNSFTDSSEISSWASDAVQTVVSMGIMSGRTDGSFDPDGQATRAEMSVVMERLAEMLTETAVSDTTLASILAEVQDINAYTDYAEDDYQTVELNGSSINFDGTGATVSGSDITITAAGTYVFSGALNDGCIIVDSEEEKNVKIILNNAKITCSDGAAIYVKACGKNVVISLPPGTSNSVTDGQTYTNSYVVDDEPGAAIFSKDDLRINGSGTLTVTANYNDGITGRDDLEITEATLKITAADDGIVGKDSVLIASGNITINAEGDGIKSTNDTDTDKGYIGIAGGTFDIEAGNDGIQAETILLTAGGTFDITTGDGAAAANTTQNQWQKPGGTRQDRGDGTFTPPNVQQNADGTFTPPTAPQNTDGTFTPPTSQQNTQTTVNSTQATNGTATEATETNAAATTATTATAAEEESCKGLKAGDNITIQKGTFEFDCQDDAIHSNNSAAINGGTFTIQSGDDGIHSDTKLTISGGTIKITKSYEGIESADLNLSGGNINIVASDDAINAAGGNDSSGTAEGGFGKDGFGASSSGTLTISGGTITANAGGDGIDVNGSITMTGGTVTVYGPEDSGNGALDYDKTFNISGGTLAAFGSSGMAMAPSDSSTQYTFATTVTAQSSGTAITIKDSNGSTILSYTSEKAFSHVVISSPLLKKGETYTIYAGSTSLAEVTLNSVVTNTGGGGMQMPGGTMPGGGERPGGQGGQRPEGFPTEVTDGNVTTGTGGTIGS